MASKRRIRKRMCVIKKRYADQTEAVSAIIYFKTKQGRFMRSYKCPNCHGWHLTSKPLRK